jgi:hypothetical protein
MIKSALCLATALLIGGPAAAFAQDAQHLAPGEGYRIPVMTRTSNQPLAAYQTNLSSAGDGYRIVPAPRTGTQPLAAYPTNPATPGDGYRMK